VKEVIPSHLKKTLEEMRKKPLKFKRLEDFINELPEAVKE